MYYQNPQGEFPRYIGDIALENPDWSETDELPAGWRIVNVADYPELTELETAEFGPVLEVDGQLTVDWVIRPLNEQELFFLEQRKLARAALISQPDESSVI